MTASRLQAAAGAAQRLRPPSSRGLDWPRRGEGSRTRSEEERARLVHYDRLMGLAHVVAVATALVATMVHLDFMSRPATGWFGLLLGTTLVFAAVYHWLLPAAWCSHTKVVLGLVIDAALVTAVVHLTGYHMSLLVFLYYLIVIAASLTLETRAMYALCAVITVLFLAILPWDPMMVSAWREHAGHVALFVLSVWLVGLVSGAATSQLHKAERRLLSSLNVQRDIAAANLQLSADLAEQLDATRALAVSLERQRQETRRLADMVIRAQEEERGRVARELHDEANQILAALMTTVDTADALQSADAQGGNPALRETLARLRKLAGTALGDLQRIATELRPPALDEFGLLPALTRHVRDRVEGTCLRADVQIEGRRRRLPQAVELALYRIAQEALANVQKHARAGCVHVRLRFLPDAVRLDVSDDGVGFADGADGADVHGAGGLGLPGMRERASIVGGSVEVSSSPGGGTRVSARIPLERAGARLLDAAAS
ncbi:MAG TPA: sensor histidine kinase [Candidatus Dormibacteraeota bacterium]|nr:sensor histidine kinase [Candidatus Dormibacteraeota bacterium]